MIAYPIDGEYIIYPTRQREGKKETEIEKEKFLVLVFFLHMIIIKVPSGSR